jgi:hypothetical protein
MSTELNYKAEIEKLRAENARLQSLTTSSVRIDKRIGKDGKTWISVKGIPGTGWGISAQPQGWQMFMDQFETIKPQVKNLL